jgi:hypothetical protein
VWVEVLLVPPLALEDLMPGSEPPSGGRFAAGATLTESGFGGGLFETYTLVSQSWYYYNDDGNVTRVVTNLASDGQSTPAYSAVRMDYGLNRRSVTAILRETWLPATDNRFS